MRLSADATPTHPSTRSSWRRCSALLYKVGRGTVRQHTKSPAKARKSSCSKRREVITTMVHVSSSGPLPPKKTAPRTTIPFALICLDSKPFLFINNFHNPTKEQLFKQLTSPETNRWTVKLRSRFVFKGTQVTQVICWGSAHRLVQSCLWRASIIVHAAQVFDLSIQLGWFFVGVFCDVYGVWGEAGEDVNIGL